MLGFHVNLSGRLIIGLLSKKDCTRLLKPTDSGTFVIRFSDSVAGSFAIAYSTNDPNNAVKHYLVKPEDIGSNKSLPDFLREKKVFKTIIRLNPVSGRTCTISKDTAFDSYYSKRGPNQEKPLVGYVQDVQ